MIRIFLITTSLILFISCSPVNGQKLVTTTSTVKATDDEIEVNITRTLFSSHENRLNESSGIFNDSIDSFINRMKENVELSARKTFREIEQNGLSRPPWQYSFYVKDSVFLATNELISMRLTVYEFTGGAHGMTAFYAFNYDLKNRRFLMDEEIIRQVDAERINQQMIMHLEDPYNCFNTDPDLELVSAINLLPGGFCFTFEQYVLGPYACGPAEITIPWPEENTCD